jgi:TolB-like protein/predicted Ser/Thr protein kinase
MAASGSDDDQTRSFTNLAAGTTVSHYRIISKIGAGGMGEVYLAEDTQLSRRVALKFLPAHLCQDEDCRKRFKREAQAAAKLDHPNIVPVHEVGEFQGRPFFAMAHIEGKSLREVIKEGKLSISEAIELTRQICEGLHKAHEAGVVHRDIKPGNIIIDSDNKARILDFGLAMVAGEEKLTKTGSTLGTVGYMSPEQIEGKRVDHRSDLFSVGVILYEMLTGRRPFEGDTDAAVARSITDTYPEPIARYRSGTTGQLQQIVDKALSKDPTMRYQHADGMLADLKRLKINQSKTKKSRFGQWAAVAAIVIAVAYLGYNRYFSDEAGTVQTERKMLAVLPFENLGGEEDEGFADGITDAITSRIAKISGLGVIARTSVLQYKGTTKRIEEIGAELGVGYVLEGTILWDRSGDTDRVRITPQLIQVSDESHMWAETYERAMTGIFEVQADIASTIAENLDIALIQQEQDALADRPTENMEAYQSYLAGRSYGLDTLAGRMYLRAIQLDSSFALADAELSMFYTRRYHYGYDRTEACLQLAYDAASTAHDLQSDMPEVHLALGYYYYYGFREYDKAMEEFLLAEKGLPNSIPVLLAVGYIWRRRGHFEDAVRNFERAQQLDPQNTETMTALGETLTMIGNYQQAMSAFDRAISLRPDRAANYFEKAELLAFQGDLGQARSVLAQAPPRVNSSPVQQPLRIWLHLDMFEHKYADALERLATAPEKYYWDVWGYSFTTYGAMGLIYRQLGDSERARMAFDSSLTFLESNRDKFADYNGYYSALGITYAGLGMKEQAIKQGRFGLERFPISRDALNGAARAVDLARIYVIVEEYDLAIDLLDRVMTLGAWGVTPLTLSMDPMWDPLRDHPRFQALIDKYERAHRDQGGNI